MAQQLINVGSAPNDRTGDPWRDAFIKVNANETELFNFKDSQAFNFVAQESDFATQDSTTITLEAGQIYIPTASFSTAKRFICENGSAFSTFNPFGPIVTYTGTGSMFSGVDVSFYIADCIINTSTASQLFDFSETTGGTKLFISETVSYAGSVTVGTFDKMGAVQFVNCNAATANSGITITGNSTIVFSVVRLSLLSSSASFVGIDIGTSVIGSIELDDLILSAPAGGIGIDGAASSANVASGEIATVRGGSFSGGLTPLNNITNEDIRWRFISNAGIADTVIDALLSFNGNSTETVISASNTPVIVNATWTCITESLMSCTTAGRIALLSEQDVNGPVDVSVGLVSAGGGSIDVSVYLALNGSVISNSQTSISISGSSQAYVSIPWQLTLSENDYLEVFVENNTNTTNIIVESAKFRFK